MRARFVICITAVVLCCSVAHGVTLTFDEVSSGTVLRYSTYGDDHRVSFSDDFRATDHTGSGWGPPRSGSNVLTSSGSAYSRLLFGYYTPSDIEPDPAQSVTAYFSTELDAMVRITAYHIAEAQPAVLITSVVIGASGKSWNNRYIEMSASPGLSFEMLEFEGVNSADDLLGFCADDMTITLVPEPSSLIAVAGGLAGLGGMALRRRRR